MTRRFHLVSQHMKLTVLSLMLLCSLWIAGFDGADTNSRRKSNLRLEHLENDDFSRMQSASIPGDVRRVAALTDSLIRTILQSPNTFSVLELQQSFDTTLKVVIDGLGAWIDSLASQEENVTVDRFLAHIVGDARIQNDDTRTLNKASFMELVSIFRPYASTLQILCVQHAEKLPIVLELIVQCLEHLRMALVTLSPRELDAALRNLLFSKGSAVEQFAIELWRKLRSYVVDGVEMPIEGLRVVTASRDSIGASVYPVVSVVTSICAMLRRLDVTILTQREILRDILTAFSAELRAICAVNELSEQRTVETVDACVEPHEHNVLRLVCVLSAAASRSRESCTADAMDVVSNLMHIVHSSFGRDFCRVFDSVVRALPDVLSHDDFSSFFHHFIVILELTVASIRREHDVDGVYFRVPPEGEMTEPSRHPIDVFTENLHALAQFSDMHTASRQLGACMASIARLSIYFQTDRLFEENVMKQLMWGAKRIVSVAMAASPLRQAILSGAIGPGFESRIRQEVYALDVMNDAVGAEALVSALNALVWNLVDARTGKVDEKALDHVLDAMHHVLMEESHAFHARVLKQLAILSQQTSSIMRMLTFGSSIHATQHDYERLPDADPSESGSDAQGKASDYLTKSYDSEESLDEHSFPVGYTEYYSVMGSDGSTPPPVLARENDPLLELAIDGSDRESHSPVSPLTCSSNADADADADNTDFSPITFGTDTPGLVDFSDADENTSVFKHLSDDDEDE